MRPESKVELVVLIVAAVIVGGWLGVRLARGPERPEEEAAAGGTSKAETLKAPTTRSQTPKLLKEKPKPKPQPIVAVKPLPVKRPEPPKAESPKPEPDPTFLKATALFEAGKPFEARKLLTSLILTTPEGKKREQVRKFLDLINRKLFFSRAPSPDCIFHKVQPGDNLSDIAKKAKKDFYFSDLIVRVNNIKNPNRLRIGWKLKIPQGTFSAIVQKRVHRLMIFLNGHYIREYPVAIGAPESPTPEGKFIVSIKQKEPTWTTPEGKVYKFGNPKNILGTRWIGFAETEEHVGIGIHGTNDPKSVGKSISNGCIRMHNANVEEIFGMLMSGNFVAIVK